MSSSSSSSLSLTSQQQQTLESFREILQLEDEDLAISILSQYDWNLERALNSYVTDNTIGEEPSRSRGSHSLPNNSNNNSTTTGSSSSSSANANNNNNNNNPHSLTRRRRDGNNSTTSSNTAYYNSSNNSNNNENINNTDSSYLAIVFGYLFVPLKWLFQSQPLALHPEDDTNRFVDELQRHYPSQLEDGSYPFLRTSYQAAVQQAFQQQKLLGIYLHSPLHEDNDIFCSQILGGRIVKNLLERHDVLLWAGSVWDAEGYSLSSQIRVSSFPFFALLLPQSARMVTVVDRIQGLSAFANDQQPANTTTTAGGDNTVPLTLENQFVQRLEITLGQYTEVIQRNRIEAQRRNEAAQLRAEQDAAYEETVRQEEARQAALRAEEEAREAARQAEELAQAIALSNQLARQSDMERFRSAFNSLPEPTEGGGKVIATIRFQLPDGKKLVRKFEGSESIDRIFAYLKVYFYFEGQDQVKNFSVSTNYPKVELTEGSGKTVEEMGLTPRSMLFVTDLDA
eukprot:gene4155-4564_t